MIHCPLFNIFYSIHLYHLFPQLPVGKLSMYRKLLVKNNHLSMCAEVYTCMYMLYYNCGFEFRERQ